LRTTRRSALAGTATLAAAPPPGASARRARAHLCGADPAGDRHAEAIPKILADSIGEALKDSASARAMTQGRMEIPPLALDEFAAYVKKETGWWAKSIQAAGIEPE
jgi:hypothetical protein